jgi:peptidoglycan/LPS O-acetylase OafA/YrhL
MNNRLGGLDGLRALSVIWVLLIHSAHLPGFPTWTWLRRLAGAGGNGVLIFFVISGFLITWLLLNEESKHGSFSLGQFYFRRAMRILPPAFAYLLGLSLLGLAKPGEVLACTLFVRNLGWFTDGGHSLTGHFWSLSVEEQFYLLWPFLMQRLPVRWRIPVTAGLCLAAPVWRQVNMWTIGGDHLNWSRLDFRYDYLLWGVLLALVQRAPEYRKALGLATRHGTLGFGAGAGLLGVFWLGNLRLPGYVLAFLPTVVTILVSYLILLLVEERSKLVSRIFAWGPAVWLGRLSYSLYLWHELFCFQTQWPSLRHCGLALALSLLAAVMSYYLIEKPSFAWRTALQNRFWKTPPAPANATG